MVTAGVISVVGIISVVIGGHFGGGDHFDGGDHFGGGTTFRKRFVSGSLFVSPCPPECYLQSETKIEPDVRLIAYRSTQKCRAYQTLCKITHLYN